MATWTNSPGIGASSISSAHDPSAAFRQSSAAQKGTRPRGDEAYIGHRGSLPGTSSAVPSSWALQKPPLAICVVVLVAVPSGAKKSRLAKKVTPAICARQDRLTHDCGWSDYARRTILFFARCLIRVLRASGTLGLRGVWLRGVS